MALLPFLLVNSPLPAQGKVAIGILPQPTSASLFVVFFIETFIAGQIGPSPWYKNDFLARGIICGQGPVQQVRVSCLSEHQIGWV